MPGPLVIDPGAELLLSLPLIKASLRTVDRPEGSAEELEKDF
jgi:hypothetical protein